MPWPRYERFKERFQCELFCKQSNVACAALLSGAKLLVHGIRRRWQIAAVAYTLTETAKLNSVDPRALLTDTQARITDHKINRIDELLPWR